MEYVEDAFTPSHIQAHKKFSAKLKASHPNVSLASGHPLFKSNLEDIKELTMLIQPEPEEEDEEVNAETQ